LVWVRWAELEAPATACGGIRPQADGESPLLVGRRIPNCAVESFHSLGAAGAHKRNRTPAHSYVLVPLAP
jgi:hypothetical protein